MRSLRGEFNADIVTRFSEQIYPTFWDVFQDAFWDNFWDTFSDIFFLR